ncbi:2-phospho-L-lactate guanylyltransferase [Herbiconiux sp. P15]|uniref:2-phospho-L-lactate guanylyltransferase n=1 Tax=Herbiconiux liukaitaii TaxID=3342799 RepID=UPI0035B859CF
MTPDPTWTLVMPVKGTADGKSRLAPELDPAARRRLAEAFSLDALAAVRGATSVARVIVVTDAATPLAERLRQAGAEVVDDPGRGLNPAVLAGLVHAGPVGMSRIAVLLGDLPCLAPADLDEALHAAAAHPLAFVPDAEGTGTTLVTATPGHPLVPRFGQGSAERHRRAGHVLLPIAADSALRRDVDTADDLHAARALGLGPLSALAAG